MHDFIYHSIGNNYHYSTTKLLRNAEICKKNGRPASSTGWRHCRATLSEGVFLQRMLMNPRIYPIKLLLCERASVGDGGKVKCHQILAGSGRSKVTLVLIEVVHTSAKIDIPAVIGSELEFTVSKLHLA